MMPMEYPARIKDFMKDSNKRTKNISTIIP